MMIRGLIPIALFLACSQGLSAQCADRSWQECVNQIYAGSYHLQDGSRLAELQISFEESGEVYWAAYTRFLMGAFEQYRDLPNLKLAEKYSGEAVDMLREISNKDEEDYALLSYAMGYTLQWKSGPRKWRDANLTKTWAKRAVEINPTSPRACFVYGNLDLHTPKALGGRKQAYQLLHAALDKLRMPVIGSSNQPSWGLKKTYQSIIRYCIDEDLNQEADELLKEALARFSDDRELLSMQKEVL